MAVNEHTAKCSPCGDYQLVLSWTGAAAKTAAYSLNIFPEKKKDGTLCSVSPKLFGKNIITSGSKSLKKSERNTFTFFPLHHLFHVQMYVELCLEMPIL